MNIEVDKTENTKEIKLSQFVPYLGSIIIFLGILRLIVFYKAFGVSIIDYLDFTEIITSFLDIIVIAVLLIATSVFNAFIQHDDSKIERLDSIRYQLIHNERSLKHFILYFKFFKDAFIITLLWLLLNGIIRFFNPDFSVEYSYGIVLGLLIAIILIIISIEIERKHRIINSSKERKKRIRIFVNSLLFIVIIQVLALYQVYEIKNNSKTLGTVIVLDNDKKLVSDKSNYFIGKTQNYVFIYHKKSKMTDVYPISRIKQITLINKSSNHLLK